MCRKQSRRSLAMSSVMRSGVHINLYHTKIQDKLCNLQSCNPFLPPDPDSPCALEVVPIHDDVDREVESNGNP